MLQKVFGILFLAKFKARKKIMECRRAGKPIKLNVGCGFDKREGYVNVDSDRRFSPDIIANGAKLDMFEDNSVDVVECYHLFEHLTFSDAVDALKEWHRVLKKGGKLSLELPNLTRCVEILHKKEGKDAEDHAMMGLFGQIPKSLKKESIFQIHKYGWTFEELTEELGKAGFTKSMKTPVTQVNRPATKYNRDMRVESIK